MCRLIDSKADAIVDLTMKKRHFYLFSCEFTSSVLRLLRTHIFINNGRNKASDCGARDGGGGDMGSGVLVNLTLKFIR